MSGQYTLHEPGSRVPVVVEADDDGNIPDGGDLVAIVGESRRGTHVSIPSERGTAVGLLSRLPFESDGKSADSDDEYDSGEVVGDSQIRLRHAVDWADADDDTIGPGDFVVGDVGGGVDAYDEEGDTPEMIIGPVWTTLQRADGTAGKVAVVRQR